MPHHPSPPPLLQGCRNVNHYERIGMIAQGTYGVVYRAKNTVTKEIVALKQVGGIDTIDTLIHRWIGHRELMALIDRRRS